MKAQLVLDGKPVRWRELPRHIRQGIRRIHRRAHHRYRRPRATGILCAQTLGAFIPVTHIFTSGSAATETIPSGASNVTAECWGGGGSGGAGAGTGCAAQGGGGGGAGGFALRALSVITQNGATFTYTVGAAAVGAAGANNSINAGTVTGWTNLTANGGARGGTASGSPGGGGTGGTASGGTTNTTGGTGQAGSAGTGGNGATGTTGSVSGDGSPYGGGGLGGAHSGLGGSNGLVGAAVFAYT